MSAAGTFLPYRDEFRTAASGRFDLLAKPSANGRYLRIVIVNGVGTRTSAFSPTLRKYADWV
jgi:hypothetical protein